MGAAPAPLGLGHGLRPTDAAHRQGPRSPRKSTRRLISQRCASLDTSACSERTSSRRSSSSASPTTCHARLETKCAAEGLSLSRSVMCNSTIRCAELLEPIYKAVREEVLASLAHSVLQIDDSEVVQRNGPRPGERKVNIWAIRDQHAGVFYSATNSRNRDGPKDILGGRRGRLQSDGHDCFDGLDPDLITRIGCWAHVRRYFDKARKVGDTNALKVIDWIGKLFAVERLAKKQADAGKALTDAELVALGESNRSPSSMRSRLGSIRPKPNRRACRVAR
ncbi:MAG: transposase [Planctomycetota bacterium]